MIVALYARCSTRDKQDVETQLMPLRDSAKARGSIAAVEYVDVGWSGSKERRPELDLLMRHARQGKFEAVLVARFDRFARSTKHLLTALAEFDRLHIHFISLNESIDTSTAMGKMIFTVLGAVAELERSLIRERVQAGVDRAKRQGKQLGRPKRIFDRDGVVRRYSSGASIKAVAKEFGVSWATAKTAIREALEKPSAEANILC